MKLVLRLLGRLNTKVSWKPTDTGSYLHIDSYHPLERKRFLIRTLSYLVENISSVTEEKLKEHKRVSKWLEVCGHPNCKFVKSATKTSRKNNKASNTKKTYRSKAF